MNIWEKIGLGQKIDTGSKSVNKEVAEMARNRQVEEKAEKGEVNIEPFLAKAREQVNSLVNREKGRDSKFSKLANNPQAFEAEVVKTAKILAQGKKETYNVGL